MINKFFHKFSTRYMLFITFLFCALSVGYALYSQIVNHSEPCPLCIAQRLVYIVIGFISLIGFIHGPQKIGRYIYSILVTIFAIGGFLLAHHHVYLQSLPPDDWPMSCGMPLEILFKQMPLTGFIHTVLSGTAECAMIDWTVFGISGPKMSMIGFIVLVLIGAYILVQQLVSKKM